MKLTSILLIATMLMLGGGIAEAQSSMSGLRSRPRDNLTPPVRSCLLSVEVPSDDLLSGQV